MLSRRWCTTTYANFGGNKKSWFITNCLAIG